MGWDVKEGDSRQRIIVSALHCFSEQSVEKTSLLEVARRAGISKGTLYYYYPTKNDLIFDIASIHMDRITDQVFSMMESGKLNPSWAELIETLFAALLGSDTRSRLHLYLIHESLKGNTVLRERLDATYTRWFELVAWGVSRMIHGAPVPKGLPKLFVALMDGLVIQSVTLKEAPDLKEMASLAAGLMADAEET